MDLQERLQARYKRQELDEQIRQDVLSQVVQELAQEGDDAYLRDKDGRHSLSQLPAQLQERLNLALEEGLNLTHIILNEWAQTQRNEELHKLLANKNLDKDHPLANQLQTLTHMHKALREADMTLTQMQAAYENGEISDPSLLDLIEQGALNGLKDVYQQERLARMDEKILQQKLQEDLNLPQRRLLEGEARRRQHGSAFDYEGAQGDLVREMADVLGEPRLAARLAPKMIETTRSAYWPQSPAWPTPETGKATLDIDH